MKEIYIAVAIIAIIIALRMANPISNDKLAKPINNDKLAHFKAKGKTKNTQKTRVLGLNKNPLVLMNKRKIRKCNFFNQSYLKY